MAASPLARVVYHSRATHPFETSALDAMIAAAQARNAAESVTGVVVYDRARFYQWLEGPAGSVDRILRSINADRRHTGIEVLGHDPAATRVFSGWDMQLAGRAGCGDGIRVPEGVLAALRRDPGAATDALATLAPLRPPPPRPPEGPPSRPPERPVARILRQVILARVIPELAARHRPARPGPLQHHPRTAEFTAHLARGDSRAATILFQEALPGPTHLVPLLARLAEPAARMLGDLWAEDEVTELDLTVGLCCLRTAVRQTAALAAPAPPAPRAPRVLSTARPGEPHAIGPALHPEAMWQSGWFPRITPAGPEDALLETLAAQHFDCLDLSASAALPSDDHLPALAATIARARRASRNKALAIVVGGRGLEGMGPRIGADAVIPSALAVVETVRRAVAARV